MIIIANTYLIQKIFLCQEKKQRRLKIFTAFYKSLSTLTTNTLLILTRIEYTCFDGTGNRAEEFEALGKPGWAARLA